MPFAIFRPSAVINAYREPIPGWLDGPMVVTRVICAIGLGMMHVFLAKGDVKFDVVPVDYVCNALISSAWETAVIEEWRHHEIPVYNYVSGTQNTIRFKKFLDKVCAFWGLYPTNSAIYCTSIILTKSRRLLSILEFFLHLIPALIIDSIARLFGKQPGLYNVARKIGDASRTVGCFNTREWDFEDQRTQNLWKQMGPTDRRTFPFNMQDVYWDEHVMKMIRGIRKYMIGEPDENLDQARQRQSYLHIVHTIVRLAFVIFVLWITWKIFDGLGVRIGAKTLAV